MANNANRFFPGMHRIVTSTRDGSPTLYVPELREHYHSIFGAVQESSFIYIENGLRRTDKQNIRIFEVGFGTGLNAYLTFLEAEKKNLVICYHSIEICPVEKELWLELGRYYYAGSPETDIFYTMHECEWEKEINISDSFKLRKIKADIITYRPSAIFDLIYFDAFSPLVQPEIWTTEIFRKFSGMMDGGAILTTFSSSGQVRRNLMSAGLQIERIPGPPGKREIIVAAKPV
jgi:tRNA U34 5-methylaminomethyl-2-thiouridine-forming methyltransferase MnmC